MSQKNNMKVHETRFYIDSGSGTNNFVCDQKLGINNIISQGFTKTVAEEYCELLNTGLKHLTCSLLQSD